jgi:hypothetical protein
VGGLSVVFTHLVPVQDTLVQTLLPLLATSLLVFAFQPLLNRLQRAVNQLLYGDRD